MKTGMAGRLAGAFIQSKVTPLLIVAAVLLGIFAVLKTPREEEPQIIVPMADVIVTMPGASAAEVERRVSTPMEKLIWEIPGVEYVYSTSSPGQSLVIVRFLVGENQEAAFVRLREKLQSHYDSIPPGASQPIIKPRSIDDVPILALTLHSRRYDAGALRQLAAVVEDSIKQVNQVSETTIIGGRRREIRIKLDAARMAGYGITTDSIIQALQLSNQQLNAGSFSRENTEIVVKAGSFLRTAADVGAVVVGTSAGRPIHLSDAADVRDGAEEPLNYVLFGRGPAGSAAAGRSPAGPWLRSGEYPPMLSPMEPAVTIAVAKRRGANAIDVADRVLAKVETLKGTVLPRDVEVAVTRNYGWTAAEKSNELLFHMMIAVISVTVLIALALGIRASMVVAVAIPVTLALTLLVFYLYGYTLNRITLFALIFSIGILVDDAIVVVENIARHFALPNSHKRPLIEVAIHAVDEVGNPTILATIAVIAAILPLAFVGGLMGPYMRPIPIGASAAMAFSLLIAFIVTPYVAYRVLRRPADSPAAPGSPPGSADAPGANGHSPTEPVNHDGSHDGSHSGGHDGSHSGGHDGSHEAGSNDWMTRLYRAVMTPLLRSWALRLIFFTGVIALLIGSMLLVALEVVTVKMLPFDNKAEFQIIVDMPSSATLEQTAAATRALSDYVSTVPEVVDYEMYVGAASPYNFNGLVRHYFFRNSAHQADIQVNLLPRGERKAQSHEIVRRIRPALDRIAAQWGVRLKVAEVPPGPPVLETLVAEIYGPSWNSRAQFARQVKAIFESTPGVTDVDWYMDDAQPTYQLTVDREKAALAGVDTGAVARTLATALGGMEVGLAHDEHSREDVPLFVQLSRSQRSGIRHLEGLYVESPDGRQIPLRTLVRPVAVPTDRSIYHKNLLPVVYVTGDLIGRQESPVYAILRMNQAISKIRLPDGRPVNVLSTRLPYTTHRVEMKWDGEWQITYEVFRDMGAAFAVVLILIYVIVVAWFQSFKTPLVIMAPIPLTLVGILPAHAMMGAYFTATSMIGFIAGAGIIVRNSIILVDFIELRLRQGMDLEQAVIDAGATRFRPMLLTAAAVIVGSFVILFDPIFQGLALSLMAGEIASTFLSRLAVPVLYFLVKAKERDGRAATASPPLIAP